MWEDLLNKLKPMRDIFFSLLAREARKSLALEKLGYPECWAMGIKVENEGTVPRPETLGSGATVASLC